MSKKFSLLFLLVVFCLGNGVQAAWYWKNTAGDKKWVNGGNWDTGYLVPPDASTPLSWNLITPDEYPPTEVRPGDAALGQLCRIGQDAGKYGRVHIFGGTCTVREIRLGDGGTGVVDCNGLGELTTTSYDIDLGYTASGDGTLNVWDNARVTVQRYLDVGSVGTGTLNVSGNAVVTVPIQYLTIGSGAAAVGTVNLSGNGTINIDDYVHIGVAGTGTLNMTGGTINVTNYEVNIADGGGTGTLNLSAGTISTGRHFNIGGAGASGTAVMNMTGGTVNCALTLNIPEVAGCQGTLNLDGGTFNATTLTMRTGGLLNVAGGTLKLNGNVVTSILSNPQIIGHYGYGTVNAVYDGTYTTVTATAPNTPYLLSPTGTGVDPAANLFWRSAEGAISATVYFGTSEALVTARDAGVQYTGVSSPFDVVPGNMPYATTYYWRVDETDGVSTFSSPVLSFTTVDINPYASNLSPVGEGAPLTSNLDWTPGYYATESHVYFGTDEAAVTARSSDPNVYRGIQTPPYDPIPAGDFPYMSTYYWVVDTVGDDGQGNTFWPGTVVSFTTERPTPPTTATWDPIDPNNNLEWKRLENWSPDRLGAGVTSDIIGDPNTRPAIVTNGYLANEATTVRIGVGQPGKVRVETGSTLLGGTGATSLHKIVVGYDARGILEVDGGTATGGQWFEVGTTSGTHGTVVLTNGATVSTAVYDYNKNVAGSSDTTVSGGSTLSATRHLYVGGNNPSSGYHTLTINDAGSLASGNIVWIAAVDGSRGIVTVNGGTLQDRGGGTRVGDKGDGQLIVNGGFVEATSLRIPYVSATGTGHVQLDGGLITATTFSMYENGTMDITGGTLKIAGNAVSSVLTIYAGAITAYSGWGTVNAVYDSETDKTIVTATAPDGSVIDPFESYADTSELNGAWTATGSSIWLETTNVYAGGKAMRVDYSGSSSEAGKVLSLDVSAITAFDAKALTLYFAGAPGNADLPLSVRLESNAGNASIEYDASTSLADPDWVEWNLDLAAFTGVDLNAITKIAIVIGDGGASGSGTLYFDQIQLNPARCVPELAAGDTNGDCISNMWDFLILSRDWLDAGYMVVPADPGTGNLVLHYKLDDPNVVDETGNYNGTALGSGGSWPTTGGYDGGGYVRFVGTNYIEVPPSSLSTVASTGEVSVSVWVRGSTSEPITSRQMLFSARTVSSEGHILTANMPHTLESGGMGIVFEAGHDIDREDWWETWYWGWDTTEWEAPESAYRGSTWNHYVFTKDIAAGDQKIYHNGQLVAVTKGARTPIEYVGMFIIGNFYPSATIEYYGDVDDFRVYDKALSPDEVLYLAGGSSYYQPVVSNVDFDDSDDIGIGDLAIMAAKWLEEQLWPAP